MSANSRDRARNQARAQLGRTPGCIEFDRMGETLTAAEQDHLATCTRCQADFALWDEFIESRPRADEGAAVQWIVAELGRRAPPSSDMTPARGPGWFARRRVAALATAAAVVLVAGAGYLTWNPEPTPRAPATDAVYRTAAVSVIAPTGDVPVAPKELTWAPIEGASRYDVRVLEVDHTIVWRISSPASRVELPPAVIEQLVPGKTVLWDVTARDAAGKSLAVSGEQRVRVAVSRPPGRS